MYEQLTFTIQGRSPLVMHNGQLANPMNSWVKAMKAITSKRKKTDDDLIELSRLEFNGGLYVDEQGRPVMPGENIEAAIVKAAGKQKLKQQALAGVLSDGAWQIIYDGPKSAEKLWENKGFVDVRRARVNGGSSVMRTRPIFRRWSMEFTVQYLADQLNKDELISLVRTVGQIVGLGDYRPKFGRFEVTKIS